MLGMRLLVGVAVAAAIGVGCGGGSDSPDASVPDAPLDAAPECTSAEDCEDGLACNGEARCDAGRCVAGTPLRCDDGIDCTSDYCSEELRRCVNRPVDEDGDGVAASACVDTRGMPLGTDCQDTNAGVFPGAAELCDAMGVDEDCDPTTRGGRDGDGDGFEDAACCNGTGPEACGTDCNDAARGASPDATEVCNAIDDDCDGMIDEGVLVTVYRDADGDGRGVTAMPTMACATTSGYAAEGGDCDDTSALRSPTLPEVCDGIDNDCDGTPDPADTPIVATWYVDGDGDGFGDPSRFVESCAPPVGRYSLLGTDCDDDTASRHPAQAELCNAIDDDCNGVADFAIAPGDLEDDDLDGRADARCTPRPMEPDCDDRDASSGPGASEVCDGRDNDCDGSVDEDVAATPFFRDEDGDGYGSESSGLVFGCAPPSGYVPRAGDCDDGTFERRPGADELCNGTDDDCDRSIDEGPDAALCTGAGLVCVRGACRPTLTCTGTSRDCDGDARNGCETDIATSPDDCGSCGRACPADLHVTTWGCVASTCEFDRTAACEAGWGDCNFDPLDGCELSLTTLASCGMCGRACVGGSATWVCTGGSCAVSACLGGFLSCDGITENGCEVPPNDMHHCGTCGRDCAPATNSVATCTVTTCSAPSCAGGFVDCNGDLAMGAAGNGCETVGSCSRVTWATTWGGTADDTPLNQGAVIDVATDGAGNVYVLTSFSGNTVVNGSPYSAVPEGGLLIALTAAGTFRWVRSILVDPMGFLSPERLAVEPGGGAVYVVGGGTGGTLTVGGVAAGTLDGDNTGFVFQVSSAGSLGWSRVLRPSTAPCRLMAVDYNATDGEVAVGGSFGSDLNLGAGVMLSSPDFEDGFVARLSAGTGATVSAFRLGGSSAYEGVMALDVVETDPMRDIVVGGYYAGGESAMGAIMLPPAAGTNGFIARCSRTGGVGFALGIATASEEQVNEVRAGPAGEWFFSGLYLGSTSVGAFTLSGASTGSFLGAVRYVGGSVPWVIGQTDGGNAVHGIRRFRVDVANRIHAAFTSVTDAATRFGGTAFSSAGGPDPHLAIVTGSSGAVTRLESFDSSSDMAGNAMALTPSGGHLIAGAFAATTTIGGAPGVLFTSAGMTDQYVMAIPAL